MAIQRPQRGERGDAAPRDATVRVATPLDSRSQRSSSATSCAVSGRSSGAFARHRRTSRSSAGGVSGWSVGERGRLAFHDGRHQARRARRPRTPACPSASRRGSRPAPRGRCAHRPASPRPAPAPCTAACRRWCPRSVSGARLRRHRREARGRRLLAVARQLREAEVEQLRARLRQHHVAGLQVAVDHALPVRGRQRVRDLGGDRSAPAPAAAAPSPGAARASRRRGAPSRGTVEPSWSPTS